MTAVPRPPTGLQEPGKRLWRSVMGTFELDEHDRIILAAACEAADRAAEAKAAVDRDGITIEGRYGPRAHPAIAIERDARLAMLRAIRELGLNLETTPTPRPPSRFRGR